MKLLRSIFFIFLALFGVLSAKAEVIFTKGAGQWHTLPFADVRLLSCTTGSLDRNLLVGGLQIKIHPGWVLKKPSLKPLSENGVLDYPVRPHPINVDSYTGTILLPIVYNAQAQTELHFGVQGNLEGCWDEKCLDLPIRVELPLDPQESDYTSFCGYIMEEMRQVPKLDLKMGSGHYIDDHTALLRFHVPRINLAFLQNQNGLNFEVLQTQVWNDHVQFKVTYPEIWENKTARDWILITNQGVFRAPVLLDDKPLPSKNDSFPLGKFLLVGILFFVCSPFFILWGTAFPRTQKKLKQQCLHAMVISGLLAIGAIFVQKYMPLPNQWGQIILPYILVIMGLTLIWPPRFVWWAGLLFIIWPKFYLNGIINLPFYALLPWLLICSIFPFAVLYRFADFWGKKARNSLKKGFFYHNLFFLLPTICLLGWGIYQSRLEISYETTVHPKEISVVCGKSDCEKWQGMHLIDNQSSLGRTLLDLYQAQENLVLFDDLGAQTILIDTKPQKLQEYLIGLQNYRAGYRQAHPPVHSGDAPHAPSPNAN